MMATQPDTVRQMLQGFWQSALEIGETRQGLSLALPQTFPDGWQMVLDVEPHLPAGIKLSDKGRTLGWLNALGQNIETDAVSRHVREICEECQLERDGLELFHWFPKGIEGSDIHVFSEALVNISHLHYLSDLKPKTLDLPDQTLRTVFADLHIKPQADAMLHGKVRKDVKVDYFIATGQPTAFQLIRRQGRILSTMEQWGFRWNDLRSIHSALRPAMIYDPYHQEIDESSRAIGEQVCSLFCSYEDTDRIHEFLSE